MTSRYEVYWIHLESHTDITSQGYVGITRSSSQKRFKEHVYASKSEANAHKVIYKAFRKHGADSMKLKVLCVCDKEYARYLENALRPQPFIGWNMNVGGMLLPERSAESIKAGTEKRKKTMEGRHKRGPEHPNWKGGHSLERFVRKPWTEEKRKEAGRKSAEKRRGMKASDESKRKMSEAKKGMFVGDNNPFADLTEYTFVRDSDGFEITCTRSELRKLFDLGDSLKKLFYKKSPRKRVYGWRLKYAETQETIEGF